MIDKKGELGGKKDNHDVEHKLNAVDLVDQDKNTFMNSSMDCRAMKEKDDYRDFASKIVVGNQEVFFLDEDEIVKKMEGMIDLLDIVL